MTFSNPKNNRLFLAGAFCLVAVLAIAIWQIAAGTELRGVAVPTSETASQSLRAQQDETQSVATALGRADLRESARTELDAKSEAVSKDSPPTAVPVTIQVRESPQTRLADVQVLVRMGKETFTGSTDSEGEVTFQLPPSNAFLIVETTTPGFFHGRHRRRQTSLIRVIACREVIVTGRVLDKETREPVQATLRYVHDQCERVCSTQELLTNPGGRFELSATNTIEDAGLWASAPGYASFRAQGPQADGADYEILIERGFEIRGTVIDITTEAPVPGARIDSSDGMRLVADELGMFVGRVRLNAEQSSSLPAPIPGTAAARARARTRLLNLTVHAPNFLSVGLAVDSSALGSNTNLTLPLLRGTSVFGSVSTEDGVPLAGVRVNLEGSSIEEATRVIRNASLPPVVVNIARTADHSPHGVTDLAGEFRIDGFLPWSEGDCLTPYLESQSLADPLLIATGDPGSSKEIHLVVATPKPRSVKVTGKFTFLGKPHGGRIWWKTETDSGFAHVDEAGEYWFFSSPGETAITATPDLRFTNLSNALGYVDLEETVERAFEADQAYRVNFEIDVELGEISGTVRNTAGDPISQLDLRVSSMALDCLVEDYRATDENGVFSFTLPPDEAGYELLLHRGERWFTYPNLHVGDPELEITLPGIVGVAFRVRDSETSAPIPRFSIGQRKPPEIIYHSPFFVLSACEGGELDMFCCEVIEQPHELVVDADGFVAKELGLIDYKDGLIIDVQLDPAPWTEIRLAPSFKPLPTGTSIFLLEEGYEHVVSTTDWTQDQMRNWRNGQMGRAGRVRDSSLLHIDYSTVRAFVEGYAPGTYRFHSLPPGLVFEPATIQLGRGTAENIELSYTAQD